MWLLRLARLLSRQKPTLCDQDAATTTSEIISTTTTAIATAKDNKVHKLLLMFH